MATEYPTSDPTVGDQNESRDPLINGDGHTPFRAVRLHADTMALLDTLIDETELETQTDDYAPPTGAWEG